MRAVHRSRSGQPAWQKGEEKAEQWEHGKGELSRLEGQKWQPMGRKEASAKRKSDVPSPTPTCSKEDHPRYTAKLRQESDRKIRIEDLVEKGTKRHKDDKKKQEEDEDK